MTRLELVQSAPEDSFSEAALQSARIAYARFVRVQAARTAGRLGFGWHGTSQAPSTYQQLRAAFARSVETGAPLPVSEQNAASVVFPDATDNVAFRFWHDVSHVERGLSFRAEDELELALWHLAQLEDAGYDRTSLVHRLAEADTVGQVLLHAVAKQFAHDQLACLHGCIGSGLAAGVLAEIRRLRGEPTAPIAQAAA